MQRAIGYSRVSTEKQDLVRQEKLISEYCDCGLILLFLSSLGIHGEPALLYAFFLREEFADAP